MHAAEELDERGLSGAVLADEPEDFSLDQGEIERLESSCADEGFLDRAELEE